MRALFIAAAVAFAAFFSAGTAHAGYDDTGNPKDLGLDLVPWSKKVGEHRWDSPRDYEFTLKYFRDRFKNNSKAIKWSREVSLPAVKYIHLESLVESTKWSGINIYLLPDGRVRYFLIERAPAAPAPTAASPK